MFKAEYIEVYCQPSDSIERQGTYESISRYLKKGYSIKISRNGYWILTRPSRVLVTVHCGKNGSFTHDMRSGILGHYDRSRITDRLIETFKTDYMKGRLTILADNTSYSID